MAVEWEGAVAAALGALTGAHAEKQKATIIALVDARLAGKPEESVWDRPETCNRRTYHMRWKHDPAFAGALAEVQRLASEFKDSRVVRALAQAAERLALASPVAAAKVIELLGAGDERVRLQAAFGILDRAGQETASKGPQSAVLRVVYDDGVRDTSAEAAPEAA
jgi:hypothetical protein